ncbi:MAG: NAD(P)/FAD-dependent oxidoreductase, partial [Pseudomonadota bacterium]
MTDTRREIETWIERFDRALAVGDGAGAAELFREECFWRDMVAFTWNIVTADGRAEIAALVGDTAARTAPRNWAIAGEATLNPEGWTEAWLSFATAQGTGRAHVRLVEGRAWTLLTTLTELGDHPRGIGRNRPRGQTHGAQKGRITTAAATEATRASLGLEHQPDCVIIGGGQGGMALAARLNHLGVSNLILEKNARPGDSWRNRYPTLCLHDPVWYDHLPYLPFPANWPVFSPKDKIGDWLEMYTKVMELNYWTRSTVEHAAYDAQAKTWTV